jgi:release factor glutamine methyltransferase
MELVPRAASSTHRRIRAEAGRASFPAADQQASERALVALGAELRDCGYRFTTVTPATHQRVNRRKADHPASLEDVFGWSRPFRRDDLSEPVLSRLIDSGMYECQGNLLRSTVRFSTLRAASGDQIFVHSAFPTRQSDAVFFGPDTYRFARQLRQTVARVGRASPLRILDIGAGSGAGGLHAASLLSGTPVALTLTDINQQALRFCRINAAINRIPDVDVIESDLFASVAGRFELIVSNPPYLVDAQARLYRHGGGTLGSELSLKIVEQGIDHLAPGGVLLLYTGSAIVNGRDAFFETLQARMRAHRIRFAYEEIDPDVFGEELDHPPYDRADRIAVVSVTVADGHGEYE